MAVWCSSVQITLTEVSEGFSLMDMPGNEEAKNLGGATNASS